MTNNRNENRDSFNKKDPQKGILYMVFTMLGISGVMIISLSFQATGRPLPGLSVIIFRLGVFYIPLSLILVHLCKMGMMGVFINSGSGNILTFIIAFFRGKRHMNRLESKTLK